MGSFHDAQMIRAPFGGIDEIPDTDMNHALNKSHIQ